MIITVPLATHGSSCEVSIDVTGRCVLSITEWGKSPCSIRMPFAMTMELRELFNKAVSNGLSPEHVFRSGLTPQ